jgi:hypothetical protein
MSAYDACLPIQDLNLVDNAAVIFPHVPFNRFAGLCLLRGFSGVNPTEIISFFIEFLLCSDV